MIDGTEKPKIPLNFAERAARYKEFGYNWDFFGYSKLIFLFFVLYHFMLPGNFYCGSEIRHGIFWGINFGPVIFLFFCLKPKGFFWVLIFAPVPSSLSLEIRSVPLWA